MSSPQSADMRSLRAFAVPIYGSTFLVAAGLGAALPITPLFAQELGAGVGLAGLAVAMRGLGTMSFDVPAGLLVSRFGDRRVMIWGAWITAAAAGATALVTNTAQLLALVTTLLYMSTRVSWTWQRRKPGSQVLGFPSS